MRQRILGSIVAGALALSGLAAYAQQKDNTIKDDAKQAGKATSRAAKKTGKVVKKQTKRVVHGGAKATRKGAEKVEGKTEKK
jgi:hypothetical protein